MAKAYLDNNPPLSGVLCRCFMHVRMQQAIQSYAKEVASRKRNSPKSRYPARGRSIKWILDRHRPAAPLAAEADA